MEYFTHELINDKVIRIIDFLGNCAYLVKGSEKSCLLDTLDGFGNIYEYAKQFVDNEMICLLTHGHLDHVGGAAFFDEVLLHPNDHNLFLEHNDANFRLKGYQNNEKTKDIPIKDFNKSFEGKITFVEDGDIVSLGDINIELVLVSGHTTGILVPIIKEERIAVFGDACGVGVLLFGDDNSTNVSTYRESLLHLKKYEDKYDTVLRNHGEFASPKDVLDNVIECCDLVLTNKTEGLTVTTHGTKFNIVHPIDEFGNRLDKKHGNLKYTDNKAN